MVLDETKTNKDFYKCPKCVSFIVWQYGYDIIKDKRTQQLRCLSCGYVWREK